MQSYLHRLTGTKRAWLPEPDPGDAELSAKRRRNDERHESRWSSIIDRYSKDFEEVGDEIDLRTGEIIVDRGHLNRMRDEFDNGDGPSSTAPQRSDLLSQMVDEYSSEGEGNEEEIDEEEYDTEGDDDELSSNWPLSSPQAQKHRSASALATSTSRSTEENFQDAEESFEDRESPSPSVEETGPAQNQTVVPELPQFQMPQMGFGGQLEGAMAAMSTAMGAAIQAQMMAFMNVVLAAQNGNSTVSPAGIGFPSGAQASLAAAQAGPAARADGREREQISKPISKSTGPRQSRAALAKDKAFRAQTPGLGSLWAAAGVRGRPKKGGSKQSKYTPAPASTTKTSRPSRLRNLDVPSHATSDGESEGRRSPTEPLTWNDDGLLAAVDTPTPEPELSRFIAKKTLANRTPHGPAHKATGKVQPHNTFVNSRGSSSVQKRPAEQGSATTPFILDSDEDELTIITPSTSTVGAVRETPSGSKTKVIARVEIPTPSHDERISSKAHKRVPVATSDDHLFDSHDEESSEYEHSRNSAIRNEQSRGGLRHRKAPVNYNVKATFSGLLHGMEERPSPGNREQAIRHIVNSERADSEDLVDYELPRSAPTPAKQPAQQQNALKQTDHSDYVYRPRPHLHKYKILGNTTGVQPSPPPSKQNKHPAANISKPRDKRKTYRKITALALLASLTDEEVKAREEAWADVKNRRAQKLTYDDRPPPLPCSHCKATAATTWGSKKDERGRKECNACFQYKGRHDGQERPVSFEEFRSRATKLACENCEKMSVSDWTSVVHGKVLCTPCGRYAKRNDGDMRPIPPRQLQDCDRCGLAASNSFMLSNRAIVCASCHDELFADYDPTKDTTGAEPIPDNPNANGEVFFDRCLLIFTVNLLVAFLARKKLDRKRKVEYTANARGAPCKVCHTFQASLWRPALDNAPVCERCYYAVTDMIHEYKLRDIADEKEWRVDGLQTQDIECANCDQEIAGTMWRGDVVKGQVLCTECYHTTRGNGEMANREQTVETDSTPEPTDAPVHHERNKQHRREETAESEPAPAEGLANMLSKISTQDGREQTTEPDFVSAAGSASRSTRASTVDTTDSVLGASSGLVQTAAQISTMEFSF